MRRLVLVFILFVIPEYHSFAQESDLAATLSDVGQEYASQYVKPVVDALGMDLNSGLFHTAKVKSNFYGFHLYVGVKVFNTYLNSEDQSFNLVTKGTVPLTSTIGGTEFLFNVPASFTASNAPTVFGNEDPNTVMVTVKHDTTVSYLGTMVPVSFDSTFTQAGIGGLIRTRYVPAAIPQFEFGTIMGTNLMIRWFPSQTIDTVGKLSFFGIGFQHSISQYIPRAPVDLAVQFVWQHAKQSDTVTDQKVELTSYAANAEISKKFGVLTLYGGLQIEDSKVEVGYTFVPDGAAAEVLDPVPINFTRKGINKGRGILGFALNLGPFTTNGDVSIGQRTTISAGVGFTM